MHTGGIRGGILRIVSATSVELLKMPDCRSKVLLERPLASCNIDTESSYNIYGCNNDPSSFMHEIEVITCTLSACRESESSIAGRYNSLFYAG